jgi:hypothetical protein
MPRSLEGPLFCESSVQISSISHSHLHELYGHFISAD